MPSMNYKKFGKTICFHNLMDKNFRDMDESDLERVAEAVMDALEDFGRCWEPPRISMNNTLIIPWNAPLKYRYWQGGQSIMETLEELGADEEVKAKYRLPEGVKKS